MKKHLYLLFIIFLISFSKTFSQAGIYVKFDGIDGDLTGVHSGEFLVTAFETTDSISINVGSISAVADEPRFGLIKLQKVLVPKSNPIFMIDFAGGVHIPSATITWYNSSNTAYYQINLTLVFFQSVSILSPACAGTNCNNLYEEIHLAYDQIEWKDPVSGVSTGWNIILNKRFL